MGIIGLSLIWPYSLSQPEIRDLSLQGIPSYASVLFTLRHLEAFSSVRVDPDTLDEVRAYLSNYSPPFSG